MKILYSCLSHSWGGMEIYTVISCTELIRSGHDVVLLCLHNSSMHRNALEKGVTVHSIKSDRYFRPLEIFHLGSFINKSGFDLFHTQYSKDLWLLVPALSLFGIPQPLVLTKQLGSFIIKKDKLHQYLYGRVSKALAISTVIRNNLLDTCPLTSDKIEIVFNGVDTDRFSPEKFVRSKCRAEFGYSSTDIVVGLVGRFSPGKGHKDLIEALLKIIDNYPAIKVLLTGEASYGESNYADEVLDLIKSSKKLADKVTFTGFRSDTENILSAIDIFVFPSHAEAFGIALVEAMSMEKACICSDTDGILDIADDRSDALMFRNKDVNDLSEKLKILVEDIELRKRLGKNARLKAKKKFDLALITDQTLNIYKDLIK